MFFHLVITTKRRANTLKWTIKTCLHQNIDNFKVWVGDNRSEDGTKEVVDEWIQKDKNGSKIEYRLAPRDLSMTENYEFILHEVLKDVKDPNNEYIIYIGDDDAVIPNSLKMLDDILERHPVKSVAWRKPVYYWNNIGENSIPGLLQIESLRPNFKIHDAKAEMDKVSTDLALRVEMPETYHGANKARLFLDIIKQDGGTFFRAMWPDVYSRIRMAPYIGKSFIYIYQPITMHGISGASLGLKINHPFSDRKEVESEFGIEKSEEIAHPKLEVFPCAEIYNADSILVACEYDSSIKNFDFKVLIEKLVYKINHDSQDQEHYEHNLLKIRKIAEKNDLVPYLENYVKNNPIVSFQDDLEAYNNITWGYNPYTMKYHIDTIKYGFDNVYQAAMIVSEHIPCTPLIESSNYFLEVPFKDYVTNGVKIFFEKIISRIKR